MTNEFDKIICFGADCQTRYHLQNFLRSKYGRDRSVSYFFDWVWRKGSNDSFIEWLKKELDLTTTNWELKSVANNWQVVAAEYKTYFPHDFNFTTNDLTTCQVEMSTQIDAFLAKYKFLRDRTLRALRTGQNIALLCNSAFTEYQFRNLSEVLVSVYGTTNFKLFCFPNHNEAAEQTFFADRLLTIPVKAAQWPGDSWKNAYRVIDLSIVDSGTPTRHSVSML